MRQTLILCVLCFTAVVNAEDWQRKAVELYPQLGVAGSTFNTKFWALYQERLKSNPAFVNNPQWPVLLAQECAVQLPAQPDPQARIAAARRALLAARTASQPPPATTSAPVTPPAAPVNAKPSTELVAGKKLYNSKCGRCHEPKRPDPVDEATWTNWLTKWRGRAELTDAQYEQLLAYGKLAREAHQTKTTR